MRPSSQKIRPFLWYDGQAEEAAKFYTSIFKNSKIVRRGGPGESDIKSDEPCMAVIFQLEGVEFIAFNGGPHFKFNPAISLFVDCENQAEVDDLWNKLSAGGEAVQCGW